MKNKTMKRALSLFLAAVMIALAIPFTMLPTMAAEEETIPTTIKSAKMCAMYSDYYSLHIMYGSVRGMIDGDPFGEKTSNEKYPYFWSDEGVTRNTELYIASHDETRTYYGYALFELNAMSYLKDVTVWLAADGHTADAAKAWSDPTKKWNVNDAYDVLVSTDGVTWNLMSEVTGLHSTFPSENATLAEKTSTGDGSYEILGNRVALGGAEAKYVAIAVTGLTNENRIVIGEVTVSGTTTAPVPSEKTPAEKYAEANDGALLYTVNFKDPSYSDDYATANNHNSYYILSEDGNSIKHGLTDDKFGSDSANKRAIWGGIAISESFPLENENKYTVYFDMKFGANDSKSGSGIQVDGTNTLLIDGAGNTYWYRWNTELIGKSESDDENWTTKIGDKAADETQNFAVEIDPETEAMTLYVADHNGTFHKVRTLKNEETYIESAQKLRCAIYIRNLNGSYLSGTTNATISNVQIYKGFVAERTLTNISNVKMFATYSDGWALHPLYGSVDGMIDGDRYDSKRSKDSDYPYFYSGHDAYLNTDMYISATGETRTYYGYALLELDAMSTLSDVTVWLAADGHNAGAAAAWSNPKANWNMNNAYDVLVSADGVNWTLMGEYDDMCGDGTNKGAGFPDMYDDDSALKTVDGYLRLGHKAYLGGVEAKYVAVAVKECINETQDQIVIGELTVTGFVSSESTVKTPAEIYAEAEDGDLLKTINFNAPYWSDSYNDSNNWHDYYIVTDNGNAVKHGLYETTDFGNNNKRAMWGGLAEGEQFPIVNDDGYEYDNCYTIYFDLQFGEAANIFGAGIQVDGTNSLVVDGAGNSYWYNWNNQRVGAPTDPEENWTNKTSKAATDKQTFAIEVNANTEELILYVADADGLFNKVRTLTYEADSEGTYGAAWIDYNLTCGVYVRSLDGKVHATSNAVFSSLRIYKGLSAGQVRNGTGASVRLDTPTGIRFKSQFRKDLIDRLIETYGSENVNIGMIITPTDYLVANDVAFEMGALDACSAITGAKYVKINATTIHENNISYVIHCALVNIKEGNYDRQFSARAFIEVNGEVYKYAEFDMEDNSRSIAEVAERAYNDVKATQDSVYSNAIKLDVGTTAYSPYENRDILKTFFGEDTSASLSVMTYNIRAYGDAVDIWDKISGDYEGWAGRDPVLALETITELMPDVVGLQEDDSNLEAQYKNVPALANNYVLYNAGGNGSENNGIWVKKGITVLGQGTVYYKTEAAKYPDEENITGADFSLDTKGDNDKGRFFRWVRIEKNGEQFIVVNTHLHYMASDTSSVSDAVNKNLRKAQATIIRLWLAEMASTCSNQIVMGDMNSQGDSQEMKYGLQSGTGSLDLAVNNAIIKGDVGGTLIENNATYDHDGNPDTAEITNPNRFNVRQPWVYDHIFYSDEVLTAYEYSVVDNFDENGPTRYPSDHLPVVAKFIAK